MQYCYVPKSATFCFSNDKIELKYDTLSALFLLALYAKQEVFGRNLLKLATSVRTVKLAFLSGMFTV